MTNIIEITVRGTNELPATLAEAKAQARAQGQQIGDELAKGIKEKSGTQAGKDTGDAFAEAFDENAGQRLGEELAARNKAGMRAAGDQAGFNFTDAMGGRVRDSLPAEVEKPLEDSGKKGGQKAGDAAAGAMSPLLMGVFTTVAALGPAALIAGAGVAVAGIAALVAKSNSTVATDFANLGQDVSSTLQDAVSPFTQDVVNSIGILDQGLATAGPELKQVFAAAAPYADDIARSLVTVVDDMLPGFAAGLREAAPLMSELADFTGQVGAGLGGFAQELGTGSGGAAAGLKGLGDALAAILPDLGQIIGSLSNGLGPALKEVLMAAVPVTDALAKFVSVIPPAAIEHAAVATAALFAAFKIGTIAGVVGEGVTFLGFLRGQTVAAEAAATETQVLAGSIDKLSVSIATLAGVEEGAATGMSAVGTAEGAVAGETTALSAGLGGLGIASTATAGALGVLAGGLALTAQTASHGGEAFQEFKGKVYDAVPPMNMLVQQLKDAASGGKEAQTSIHNIVGTLNDAKAAGADTSEAIGQFDQALAGLYKTNPSAATKEFADVTQRLGLNVTQAAAAFPKYEAAIGGAGTVTQQAAVAADSFTTALQAAGDAAGDGAKKSATATLAALGLTDGQSNLTTSLYNTLQAFTLDSGAASALKTAYDALFGKFASYSDAQAQFTIALGNVAKQVTAGKDAVDLSSDAGAKNFEVFKQLADVNESRAQALLAETGSQDKANTSLYQGALALDAAAKKAKFTQEQIDQLNIALFGTKNLSNLKITVGADTSQAYGAVRQMVEYFDHQAAYVQVYASPGGNPGGHQLLAHGGVVGSIGAAAVGGVHGSLTMINEQGPELVRLPSGSTVFTNPDSQRMLERAFATAGGGGGGGGGGFAAEVSFAGDLDGAFASAFMRMIREGKIQIKQKALVP